MGKKTLESAIPLIGGGGKIVTIGSPPLCVEMVVGWEEVEKRGDGRFFIVEGNGAMMGEVGELVEKEVVKASVGNVVDGLSEEGVREAWAMALKRGGKPGTTVVKIL